MTVIEKSAGTSQAGVTGNDRAPGLGSIGYDSFLSMLLAQLRSQDPLNPTNSDQFLNQLATLSQLEQSTQQNDRLAQILAADRISQGIALVGKRISSADGKTQGVVESVKVGDVGVVATLTDGTEVDVAPGLTVVSS